MSDAYQDLSEAFPEFDLKCLNKFIENRWLKTLEFLHVRQVNIYRYSRKYVAVFEVEAEYLRTDADLLNRYESLRDNKGYFRGMLQVGVRAFIRDFAEIYKYPPGNDFLDDWDFVLWANDEPAPAEIDIDTESIHIIYTPLWTDQEPPFSNPKWQEETARKARESGFINLDALRYILAKDLQYNEFLPDLWLKYECHLGGAKTPAIKIYKERSVTWNWLFQSMAFGRVAGSEYGLKEKDTIPTWHYDSITKSVKPFDKRFDDGNPYVKLEELRVFFAIINLPLPELLFPEEAKPQKSSDTNPDEQRNSINSNHQNAFILKGDFWQCKYKGEETLIKDMERYRYIVHLLDEPNAEFYPSDLISLVKGQKVDADESYGNMTDERLEEEGLNPYKLYIEELSDTDREGLEDKIHNLWDKLMSAKKDTNEVGIKEAEKDWERLTKHFYNEYGIKVNFSSKGPFFEYKSKLNRNYEKDRVNVSKHINSAISDLKKKLPPLAGHLQAFIKTGSKCLYSTDADNAIEWHIRWRN